MSDYGTTGSSGAMRPTGNGQTLSDGDGQSPKDMVKAAASTVKQEVASFASTVQDKTQDKLQDKKEVATKGMEAFASAIRHAGDELAEHDQSAVGRVVKQAADGLEHLTRSVSEKRPEEMLEAVREFGRSNPTAFIAGSVLLGVALGRFARSSETHKSDETPTQVASQDFGSRPTSELQSGATSSTADTSFGAAGTGFRSGAGSEG